VNPTQQFRSGITLEFLCLGHKISQLETSQSFDREKLDKIATIDAALTPANRLCRLAQARQQVIEQGSGLQGPLVESWIERSWKRCLGWGHTPSQRLEFEAVSRAQIHQLQEANYPMLQAAKDELDRLSRASRIARVGTTAIGAVLAQCGRSSAALRH
jgi:hypothetical protein